VPCFVDEVLPEVAVDTGQGVASRTYELSEFLVKIAAVPYLSTALRCLAHARQLDRNSFACVISGSSRTADSEKILVQGAHGPRRLVVILQTGS
jgi:hypothetical protein